MDHLERHNPLKPMQRILCYSKPLASGHQASGFQNYFSREGLPFKPTEELRGGEWSQVGVKAPPNFTKIRLFLKFSLGCCKIYINFQLSEKVDFDSFCSILALWRNTFLKPFSLPCCVSIFFLGSMLWKTLCINSSFF